MAKIPKRTQESPNQPKECHQPTKGGPTRQMAQWKNALVRRVSSHADQPRLPSSTHAKARSRSPEAPSGRVSPIAQRAQVEHVLQISSPMLGPAPQLSSNPRRVQYAKWAPAVPTFGQLPQLSPISTHHVSETFRSRESKRATQPLRSQLLISVESNSQLRIYHLIKYLQKLISQFPHFCITHFLLVSHLLASPKHYKQR